ncbi:MAG: hypothetical protein WD066_01610 [Planctomycetaceae bacterium]
MFDGLTDDQIALVASVGAVLASALVMVLTWTVRQFVRGEKEVLPESLKVPHRRPEQKRRAA